MKAIILLQLIISISDNADLSMKIQEEERLLTDEQNKKSNSMNICKILYT